MPAGSKRARIASSETAFTAGPCFIILPLLDLAVPDATQHALRFSASAGSTPKLHRGGPAWWGSGPVAHFTRGPFRGGRHSRRGCHNPSRTLMHSTSHAIRILSKGGELAPCALVRQANVKKLEHECQIFLQQSWRVPRIQMAVRFRTVTEHRRRQA